MRNKIVEIIKDSLIIAYGITMGIFFFNILWFGSTTWAEKGWVLWGETITFIFITGLGLFWYIKDIR